MMAHTASSTKVGQFAGEPLGGSVWVETTLLSSLICGFATNQEAPPPFGQANIAI